MTVAKACPEYRYHDDPTPWRVTAGAADGSTKHCSMWTCDRHLTSTVLWAREFTGLDPRIVPGRSQVAALDAELHLIHHDLLGKVTP